MFINCTTTSLQTTYLPNILAAMITINSLVYVNVQLPSSNLAKIHHNTAANDFETGHGESADCTANADYHADNDTVDRVGEVA